MPADCTGNPAGRWWRVADGWVTGGEDSVGVWVVGRGEGFGGSSSSSSEISSRLKHSNSSSMPIKVDREVFRQVAVFSDAITVGVDAVDLAPTS